MDLKLEAKPIKDKTPTIKTAGGGEILLTPPVGEDYWLARVAVSDKQAIIAFPKFGTIGIGFQHEDDWNTNLPYSCGTKEIFDHISHNKGDEAIPDERCIQAIEMVQAYAREVKGR